MRKVLNRRAWPILLALVIFAVFFRLATLMMIHTGVDERDYWYSGKTIAHGLPYPELSHRTTRFSIILPVAAVQFLLGSRPNVYYVLPILNAALQAALAFIIGMRLRGRLTGFLAGLAMVLFPYMARAGSQVRPEIFSITYILLAFYFLVEYLDREEREILPLMWTALFLFIAYESKITNLFFVPGIILAILIYKKRPSHAFLLAGTLLGLFLLETGAYAIFTEYKFGELEIILKHHTLSGEPFVVERFLDLFQRYSSSKLQVYWQLPFLLFGIAALFYLVKGTSKSMATIAVAGLSFFLCMTFEVSSIHPIMPAEPFINRYFCAVLGPVFLMLAFAAEGIVARIAGARGKRALPDSPHVLITVLCFGAILILGIFSLPRLPSSIRAYANSPLHLDRHPLALNERYRRDINNAYEKGMPIVSVTGLAGENAISTCEYFYIDTASYRDGLPPRFSKVTIGDKPYLVLSKSASDSERYLAVIRTPFRVAAVGKDALSRLGGESFEGGDVKAEVDPDDL
jgi:hypothetical protein